MLTMWSFFSQIFPNTIVFIIGKSQINKIFGYRRSLSHRCRSGRTAVSWYDFHLSASLWRSRIQYFIYLLYRAGISIPSRWPALTRFLIRVELFLKDWFSLVESDLVVVVFELITFLEYNLDRCFLKVRVLWFI